MEQGTIAMIEAARQEAPDAAVDKVSGFAARQRQELERLRQQNVDPHFYEAERERMLVELEAFNATVLSEEAATVEIELAKRGQEHAEAAEQYPERQALRERRVSEELDAMSRQELEALAQGYTRGELEFDYRVLNLMSSRLRAEGSDAYQPLRQLMHERRASQPWTHDETGERLWNRRETLKRARSQELTLPSPDGHPDGAVRVPLKDLL
jgi:hypothetical protein